jgi:hypothetical protein
MRYFDDKVCYIGDEISYIFTLAFLWRVCVGVLGGLAVGEFYIDLAGSSVLRCVEVA